MTSRTLTREETLTVLKHLGAGKAHHVVATIARVNVKTVQELADEHGPGIVELQEAAARLQRQIEDTTAPPERPATPSFRTPSAPSTTVRPTAVPDLKTTTKIGTTEDPFPHVDDDQTARLRALINIAKAIPTKKVQRQLERALDALTTLQEYVKEDQLRNAEKRRQAEERAAERTRKAEEKAAARAEIDRLKAQLAQAQAKLRGKTTAGGASTTASNYDRDRTRAIRAWAREQGIEVAARGRIPTEISTAYDNAHAGQGDAA